MGKYTPLGEYLGAARVGDSVSLTFDQIEVIMGSRLPMSARLYSAWWANDDTHVQANSWKSRGWRTTEVHLVAERVRFERT